MIKIILPLIFLWAMEMPAGDLTCLPGEGLKQKISGFSMNLWPPLKNVNDLGIYSWISDDGKEALKINLNKIPQGHCFNMIAGMSDDVFYDFKSGGKMRVILKYSFSMKSGEMKNMPDFSLRASSEDWKKCCRLFSVLIENTEGGNKVKTFSFNGLNVPVWARRLDFQLYGCPGDAEFIVKDIDVILEQKPGIVFPVGAVISSKNSERWFSLAREENISDSDKVRIVINSEDMTYSKSIETSFADAGNIRSPDIPGFYHMSIYRKVGEQDEKMLVGDRVIYVYNE